MVENSARRRMIVVANARCCVCVLIAVTSQAYYHVEWFVACDVCGQWLLCFVCGLCVHKGFFIVLSLNFSEWNLQPFECGFLSIALMELPSSCREPCNGDRLGTRRLASYAKEWLCSGQGNLGVVRTLLG